jgi:hypothetical protein
MGWLGPALSIGGSLFGGLFGSHAAGKASKQYMEGLGKAADWLKGQEQLGLSNYAPYLGAGGKATGMLSDMLGTPGQGLLTPWTTTFQAPTAEEAAKTPGYQFALQQGENAIQNSAAGKGSLLSGRTLASMNEFGTGLANQTYNDVFNRALTQYQTSYQSFLNNQNNSYSRLMGLSGMGLGAAQGAGSLISGIGGDIASLYGQQGAAQAAGTLGSANSLMGMIPGLTGSLGQLPWGKIFGGGGGSH